MHLITEVLHLVWHQLGLLCLVFAVSCVTKATPMIVRNLKAVKQSYSLSCATGY